MLLRYEYSEGEKKAGEEYKVVEKCETIEEGFYCPLTESGTLLINGFVASCYVKHLSWIT